MSIQVSAARTALENLLRDITDVPSATFVEWCDYINKFTYRKLANTDPERFITSTTFSITAEPQTSALPTGFRDIQALGTGFFLQDTDGTDREVELARTGFGSSVMGYYITGTNIVFTGMTSQTVTLRYIPTQTAIDEAADYFTVNTAQTGIEIIPDEYQNHLVKALNVLYQQWDENVGAESFADLRFVRTLNEMIETIRKEPDSIAISDFTQNY